MLRILIADNYKIIREGLSQIIKEAFRVVYIDEVSTTGALTQKAITEPWDLIITDISIQGTGGLEALKAIKRWRPSLPVLILGSNAGEKYLTPVFSTGTAAYLHKNCSAEELKGALKQAMSWLN